MGALTSDLPRHQSWHLLFHFSSFLSLIGIIFHNDKQQDIIVLQRQGNRRRERNNNKEKGTVLSLSRPLQQPWSKNKRRRGQPIRTSEFYFVLRQRNIIHIITLTHQNKSIESNTPHRTPITYYFFTLTFSLLLSLFPSAPSAPLCLVFLLSCPRFRIYLFLVVSFRDWLRLVCGLIFLCIFVSWSHRHSFLFFGSSLFTPTQTDPLIHRWRYENERQTDWGKTTKSQRVRMKEGREDRIKRREKKCEWVGEKRQWERETGCKRHSHNRLSEQSGEERSNNSGEKEGAHFYFYSASDRMWDRSPPSLSFFFPSFLFPSLSLSPSLSIAHLPLYFIYSFIHSFTPCPFLLVGRQLG